MGTPRFTPEFKDEAVRQVVGRRYPVAQVSARLGVSAHSLYKWVKAIKPDKAEEQAAELLEAKSEILKLRAELLRTEEERDILKNRAIPCERARVKYRFINDHRGRFAVLTLCRMVQVTHAGFYAWLHKPMSDRPIEDRRLLALIRESYTASGGV